MSDSKYEWHVLQHGHDPRKVDNGIKIFEFDDPEEAADKLNELWEESELTAEILPVHK